MTSAILASIGVKTCFDTCRIVNKIVNNMISHQIKKTCFMHKNFVLLNRKIRGFKIICKSSVAVDCIYFICSDR